MFLDDTSGKNAASDQEHQANDWAANFLIPSEYTADLATLDSKSKVDAFAQSIGIHPGIVVGRLQHDGLIPANWMNDLKVGFRFRADE